MVGVFLLVLFTSCYAAPLRDEENTLEDEFASIFDFEFGDYFEGDMILTQQQKLAISTAEKNRNGLVNGVKRWPERTVIYEINEDDFDEDQVKIIESAMEDISNKSCIKFKPKEKDEHAVLIKIKAGALLDAGRILNPQLQHPKNCSFADRFRGNMTWVVCRGSANGCFSNVGYNTAGEDDEDVPQVLNLSKGCFRHGTVVHEMLHTLGFYHMQSTYNRDDYVQIIWENIKAGTEHNFAKYNNDTVTDFGVAYDYGSVMHYPEKAFSKNGNKTIIPIQEDAKIGQREGMSESDIIKLNKMYCESNMEDKMNL